MALNVSTGTPGDLAPALGAFPANHKYFVSEFIMIANPELVYSMFGTSATIPQNNSNIIVYNKVNKLGTLEATPLTEGVTPVEQQFQLVRLEKAINNIPCDHILLAIDACYSGTFDEQIALSRGKIGFRPGETISSRDLMIQRMLKHKSRLYLTSGGKERTPDGRVHSPFTT